MSDRVDVLVAGGGIAGLTAAYRLQQAGRSVALCEASDRFGGVIRTLEKDGFRLDLGPDTLLALKPEGLALCRELGLGDRIVPTLPTEQAVAVWHGGKLHALPDGMMLGVPTSITGLARSGLFSWPAKMRMGLEPFVPVRRGAADESIGSLMRRRLGQQAVERLGEPLLAGIHAGDPEMLSVRATFPRLAELEEREGSLVRGMLKAARHATPGASPFRSLQGGLGELVGALVARIESASLRPQTALTGLTRDADGFVAVNRVAVNCGITKLVHGRSGTSLVTYNDHAHFEGEHRELLTYR